MSFIKVIGIGGICRIINRPELPPLPFPLPLLPDPLDSSRLFVRGGRFLGELLLSVLAARHVVVAGRLAMKPGEEEHVYEQKRIKLTPNQTSAHISGTMIFAFSLLT